MGHQAGIKYHSRALILMGVIISFSTALLAQTITAENSDKPVFTTICKIGETKIDNADGSRYAGCREPNAVITDKGTLVVVFGPHDQDAKNDRAHQDLICRTSRENGTSWSGGLITPGWTFGYNTAVQFPDGDIGIIFEGIPPGMGELERGGWDKNELGIYLVKLNIEWLL